MTFIKVFLFFALAQCVLSGPLVMKTCKDETDIECIKDVLQDFIKVHSAGIPDKDVKPMDPMVIPEIFEPEDEFGYTSLLKNVRITGLKDSVLSEVKVTKTDEELTFKFDMTAESDVTYTKVKSGKVYSGTGKFEGSVVADVQYGYSVTIKDNVHFYEIKPETITCQADNIKTTYNKELAEEFKTDPEVAADIEAYYKKKELDGINFCLMVKPALQVVIENLRAVGRVGVKSSE